MHKAQGKQEGWLMTYVWQFKWRFACAAFLGAAAIACAGGLLFTSGYLLSRAALKPENVLMVYVPIVLVRTLGFSKAVLHYVERLISHDTALRILARMRSRLYRVIEPQAVRVQARFRTGDLLSMLAEDIEQLQYVYLRLVLPAISAVILYGTGVAMLGRMDGMFAILMSLYCGFWLFVVPAAALWISLAKWRQAKRQRSAAYQELTDAVFGMSDWLLSGRSRQMLESFHKQWSAAARLESLLRRRERLIHWISNCAAGGAIVFMVLWAGELAAKQELAASWIAALAFVAFPLLEAFVRAGDAASRLPHYLESVHRLAGTAASAECKDDAILYSGENAQTHSGLETSSKQHTNKEEASRTDRSISPVHRTIFIGPDKGALLNNNAPGAGICLQGVSYRHPSRAEWSLRDISLTVPQGGTLAILGRSGAGKSTLLNVMQGILEPEEGTVRVKPTNPICSDHGGLFARLNQQPYLFDTTVANNIRLGRSDATDEEIRLVTEQVGLHQLIAALPNGYETRMEETGQRFSGGERQRIALARILLQNRPIVLLDEPTIGLDPVTESELLATIFRALSGRTLIWVTHHLTGVERMDQIVFMERGVISMQGTHEQLLRGYDRYRRLYELDCPFKTA
ncbi:thiol reductant ABC exporter subunit CydC [Paenibacillus sp. y28]|uniref:thiol reductant ABC exporter subunit CydC n=1 Tax=Paenibacillus sp. y28 TaxID=3129110 RepID=UPI003FA750DB